MKPVSILFLTLLTRAVLCQTHAAEPPIQVKYVQSILIDSAHSVRLEQLRNQFGKNKSIPEAFEEPILVALSYYPELIEVPIKFRIKRAKLPYASRPRVASFFLPRSKRKYVITISSKSTEIRESTLLKNLSLDAQIGAMGHELAHTAYYQSKKKKKILRDGCAYHKCHFRENFEKMTDRIAIAHGLGSYLLTFSRAVYPIKKIDGSRGKVYYSPEEIEAIIDHGCESAVK
jgi:hypothetical protein